MGRSLLHLIRYLLGLDTAQTQTTQVERDSLTNHATGKMRAVEIGVFEGYNTAVIARAISARGILYAVDPFIAGRLGVCWGKWIAKREVKKGNRLARVEFVEELSADAVKRIEGDFDFVFIDGDHSLEGIRQDWADWAPRMLPGGIMALHDTRVPAHNPGVARLGSHLYFESHIRNDPRFSLIEQVDSLTILQRTV